MLGDPPAEPDPAEDLAEALAHIREAASLFEPEPEEDYAALLDADDAAVVTHGEVADAAAADGEATDWQWSGGEDAAEEAGAAAWPTDTPMLDDAGGEPTDPWLANASHLATASGAAWPGEESEWPTNASDDAGTHYAPRLGSESAALAQPAAGSTSAALAGFIPAEAALLAQAVAAYTSAQAEAPSSEQASAGQDSTPREPPAESAEPATLPADAASAEPTYASDPTEDEPPDQAGASEDSTPRTAVLSPESSTSPVAAEQLGRLPDTSAEDVVWSGAAVHAAAATMDLTRATSEWSMPRLAVPKVEVRRLPGLHWLAETAYRLLSLVPAGKATAKSAVAQAIANLVWAVLSAIVRARARVGASASATARGAKVVVLLPLTVIARLDTAVLLAALFTLSGVIVAIALALRG